MFLQNPAEMIHLAWLLSSTHHGDHEVFELVGKWLAGRLLGYGWDAVKEQFRQPRMIEAFEKACLAVVKDEPELFTEYSGEALGSRAGVPDEESLWYKLEESLSVRKFPDEAQLTEMLVACWRARMRQLDPSEASEFFSLPEDRARPILKKIAERFFMGLAQVPELRDPSIIQELQNIRALVQKGTEPPAIGFAELKKAVLRASASLLSWPRTLSENQWLERQELGILLERIDVNETSTTLLLGPPGSGKSALLSTLGHRLLEEELPVPAIKADKRASSVDNFEALSNYTRLA